MIPLIMPDPIPRGIEPEQYDHYDIIRIQEQFPSTGPRSYEVGYVPQTASTMDEARKFQLKRGVILTDHQTQGRGRSGRTWYDTPGKSVLMTVSEHFNHAEGDPSPYSPLPMQMF